jgi:hypothetical protein
VTPYHCAADCIKFTWGDLGLASIIMRIVRIKYGELANGAMELDLVKDVFSLSSSLFAPPSGTGWQAPTGAAVTPAMMLVGEAQYFVAGGENVRLHVMALAPDDLQSPIKSPLLKIQMLIIWVSNGVCTC